MREGYWAVGTIEAGPVAEKTKFWIDGARPDRRAKSRERTELRKVKQNEASAVKELARLINANFTAGDLLLGLDYSPEGYERLRGKVCPSSVSLRSTPSPQGEGKPSSALRALSPQGEGKPSSALRAPSPQGEGGPSSALRAPSPQGEGFGTEEGFEDRIREEAERQLANCIRRVKRVLEKDGVSLPCVFVTSDMDGDTGEPVRVHHHLIVPKGTEQIFVEKWEKLGWGGVSWSPLWQSSRQLDRTPVAEYLLRQVRKIPNKNQYGSSRNLIRPKAKVRAVATDALLRTPPRCTLLQMNEYKPGQAQYMRYLLPKEKAMEAERRKLRRRPGERVGDS